MRNGLISPGIEKPFSLSIFLLKLVIAYHSYTNVFSAVIPERQFSFYVLCELLSSSWEMFYNHILAHLAMCLFIVRSEPSSIFKILLRSFLYKGLKVNLVQSIVAQTQRKYLIVF
jgi:hypothetical protein